MFLVLFELVGSADCNGGIPEAIGQVYDKKLNLNSVFVAHRFTLAFVMPLDR